MDVCTFTFVPGGVQTFSNVPSLGLYNQNEEWHLTYGTVVFRRWSLSCIVAIFDCLFSRRRPKLAIWTICTFSWFGCFTLFVWLDWERSVFLGGFPGSTPFFGYRLRFLIFSFLFERPILPNVTFRVFPLWHLNQRCWIVAQRCDNIPRLWQKWCDSLIVVYEILSKIFIKLLITKHNFI